MLSFPMRIVSFLRRLAVYLPLIAVSAWCAAPAPAAGKLGSTIWAWQDVRLKPGATKGARSITNLPTATFRIFESHITTLAPGIASHGQHQHAQEEFILVKEGALEVTINGKPQMASQGSLLFYASNDFHSVRNLGTAPATYMVFNYRTSTTAQAPAQRAVDSAPAGTLKSAVFDWDKLVATPTKTGEKRVICKGPTVTLNSLEAHVTSLRAGEAAHAAHRHPDEELVVVKEGTIEAVINGKTERVGPGGILFFASNDEHGMRNVGSTRATYYVIRMVTPETPPKTS
jgi:quercetin dioxygenase-like cupin family protein